MGSVRFLAKANGQSFCLGILEFITKRNVGNDCVGLGIPIDAHVLSICIYCQAKVSVAKIHVITWHFPSVDREALRFLLFMFRIPNAEAGSMGSSMSRFEKIAG